MTNPARKNSGSHARPDAALRRRIEMLFDRLHVFFVSAPNIWAKWDAVPAAKQLQRLPRAWHPHVVRYAMRRFRTVPRIVSRKGDESYVNRRHLERCAIDSLIGSLLKNAIAQDSSILDQVCRWSRAVRGYDTCLSTSASAILKAIARHAAIAPPTRDMRAWLDHMNGGWSTRGSYFRRQTQRARELLIVAQPFAAAPTVTRTGT
ncbi:MAG: hypothetical protein ACKVU4_07520 [Phycisphaerales bacterium]